TSVMKVLRIFLYDFFLDFPGLLTQIECFNRLSALALQTAEAVRPPSQIDDIFGFVRVHLYGTFVEVDRAAEIRYGNSEFSPGPVQIAEAAGIRGQDAAKFYHSRILLY